MSRIWWKPYLYISLTHSVAQNKKTSLPPAKASKELPPLHSSGQTGCSEATTCSCCPSQLFPPILPLKRLRTLRLCRPHHNSQHMCTHTVLLLNIAYKPLWGLSNTKHTKHKGCTSVILRHTNWWACWMFILWQFENPTHVFVPSNKIATFSWLSNEDIHCIHTFVNGDFQ